MDIIINVNNQRLRITKQLSSFVSGTQEFIKFIFNLGADWDGLLVFAQFAQNGTAYNQYLDEENSVWLPAEIQPGTCTLMLYGTGGNTIATTNYLTLTIDENVFVANGESTVISQDLYNQLVNMVKDYTTSTDRLEEMISLKADLLDLNEEIVRAKGVEAGLRTDVDSRASQADLAALDGRVTELENHPVSPSEIEDAVSSEIAALIAAGAIAEMTIGDGTIAREKVDTDFEATLAKADTAMQPSVYDPNGYGSQTIPVDPYSFAQAADTIYDGTLMLSKQFTVTDANQQSYQYVGLVNALNGIFQRSEAYADAKAGAVQTNLDNYVPYSISVVSSLPQEGEEFVFYLIPKQTPGEYEKWWWIEKSSGTFGWDNFGGSSTIVATSLPQSGNPDSDYVIGTNGKYQYWKFINNEWCLISGGNGVMLGRNISGYESFMLGASAPDPNDATAENFGRFLKYVDTRTMTVYVIEENEDNTGVIWYEWYGEGRMVNNPDETTDYYICSIDGYWYHYRYIEVGQKFVQVGGGGGGGITVEEVEDLITAATSEISGDISDLTTRMDNIDNMVKDVTINAEKTELTITYADDNTSEIELDKGLDIDSAEYNINDDYTLHFYDSNGNELEGLAVQILGGGGGGGGASTGGSASIGRITGSNVQVIFGDRCEIEYSVTATDANSDPVGNGSGTLYVNNVIVKSGFDVFTSDIGAANTIDVSEYLSVGQNTIKISVSVDTGGEVNSVATKTWTVNAINMYFTWNYIDSQVNTSAFTDYYTPYGALTKTVYTFLDVNPIGFNPKVVTELPDVDDPEFDEDDVIGVNYFVGSGSSYTHYVYNSVIGSFVDGVGSLIDATTVTRSGVQQSMTIPMQSHGSHTVVRYISALINGEEIKTAQQVHDMVFVVAGTSTPIIATSFNTGTMIQYNTVQIPIVAYNPNSTTTTVYLRENGNLVSTWQNVDRTVHYWNYSPTTAGSKMLAITCGSVTKNIIINVEPLSISEAEVTGYDFRFKASEFATNDAVKAWNASYTPSGSSTEKTVNVTYSQNFDWINGGLHTEEDENGHLRQYFCVRAGTTMTINYDLFGKDYDPKQYGKNFKFIFKAVNCRTYDANVLTCVDNSQGNNGVGLTMTANEAVFRTANNSIRTYYCKDSYIEFETNIHPTSEYRYLQFWMDGSHDVNKLYDSSDTIQQVTPVGITIGSPNCDVYIYMIKAYPIYLTNTNELSNFIMDAPNAYEMVDRYNRNDILNDQGEVDYQKLATQNPDLHVLVLDINRMSTGKKDNVVAYTARHIYNTGGESECFTVTNACITIQGTSSVGYLESAGNVDINFKYNRSFTSDNETYVTGQVLFDNGETSTSGYALSENSIKVDYLNVKVNVASSENANNACIVDWYNTYQPWLSPARRKNQKARDTMEFVPGVIFIRDRSGNLFSDSTNYHFYGICDIGNSKKNTKVFHDTNNPLACCMEVSNNTSLPCLMSDNQYDWDEDAALVTEDGESITVYELRYVNDDYLDLSETAWDRFVDFMYTYNPNLATNEPITSTTFAPYTFKGSGSYNTSSYDSEDYDVVYLYGYGLPTAFMNGVYAPEDYVSDTTEGATCFYYINYSNNNIYSSDGSSWTSIGTLTWIPDQNSVLAGTTINTYAGTYTTDSFNYRMAYLLEHCEEYMVIDPVIYHFVFIESFLMTDNVAKNTFWSSDDMVHWELTKNYDSDTALGNDKQHCRFKTLSNFAKTQRWATLSKTKIISQLQRLNERDAK